MVKNIEIMSLPGDAHTHDHEYHQLVLGLRGNTDFDIAGLGQRVEAGAGCLVPCSTGHAFAGSDNNQIMVVNLPWQQSYSAQEQDLINRLFDRASYFNMDTQLQVLAGALSRELQQQPNDSLLARACGNTLLCALQHHLQIPPARRPGVIDMDLIDDYIRLHLHQKISVGQLAGLACMSNSQFHELFKKQAGMTPHQYLLEKRLQKAHQDLEQGRPLSQISDRCGFSSQSAFTHAFKRRFGITPARFRRER
ncbi:helix-turn-helix domain-containing protein [Marinobacterium arenosum]|uniref:helix-turn-helix domain-containing protein n=1 Tax=Marinobacterium arenosum TaxID=2862496 RepID=UPI001C948DF3|nr:AraC family transcriptional regulator [Marinobacterium arenosum]MBY4675563.1 AraC family transcriptional regulator [Marinobacterium arenosum]